MITSIEAREMSKTALRQCFPVGADVAALTVGYRRKTTGTSVYTVAVLATDGGRIENVSSMVAAATGATLSKDRTAVVMNGYPAELVGWLARELYESSTALTYRKV